MASLEALVTRAAAKLTTTERRIAELVIDDATAVAFLTVAELAERVGTSGPSVIRFASKLGFDGYSALQHHVRLDLAERLTRPTDRIRSGPGADIDAWSAAHERAARALADTFAPEQRDAADALSNAIASAPGNVWIVASETSSPVAQLLAANLGLLRPGVANVSGSAAAAARTVLDVGPGDIVLAIDVERYERAVIDMVTACDGRGASIVAITDSPLSPLAAVADAWLRVAVPSVGPFDSAVAVIAVAEVVVASVAGALRDSAIARLDAAESVWAERDVFIERSGRAR